MTCVPLLQAVSSAAREYPDPHIKQWQDGLGSQPVPFRRGRIRNGGKWWFTLGATVGLSARVDTGSKLPVAPADQSKPLCDGTTWCHTAAATLTMQTTLKDEREQPRDHRMGKTLVVAITGASGALYARRLLQCLARDGSDIHLVISPYGKRLLADELGITDPSPRSLVGPELERAITSYPYQDVGSRLASGSFLTDGMIVCPCSNNTLGEIAAGLGGNLISRAAAVHLKESRRLVLAPREMPLSQIDIQNMLTVSQAGGIICPASPGLYMQPRTVDDLVDFVVGKLCDLLGAQHPLNTRWRPLDAGQASKP